VTVYCDGDAVYAATSSKVARLSAKTGEKHWKVSTKGIGAHVDIKVDDGKVICSSSGYVNAFSAINGDKLWQCDLSGAGYEVVTLLQHNRVIFAATLGYVYAISIDNGQVIWKNNNKGQGFEGISLAIVSNQGLSFGMRGHLRKVHLENGEQISKSYNLKGTGFSLVAQLFYNNHLYVGSSGFVSAHHPDTYEMIWKNDLKGKGTSDGISLLPYTTSISSTPCIIVGLGGYLICLHAHSGEKQWTYSLENTGYNFVAAYVYGGNKIVAASNGKLFVINGDTGTIIHKDELAGLGYEDIWITSQTNLVNQQSSNMIMHRDASDKRKRNNSGGS